jgi:uncharacterized small protein (DUF1192 family)
VSHAQLPLIGLERDLAESRRQLSIHDAAARQCVNEVSQRCCLLEAERDRLSSQTRKAVPPQPPPDESQLLAMESCLAECCRVVFDKDASF